MLDLIKVKFFVELINKENGRNYKMSVLEQLKDDPDVKYLLDFVYNPYIITGLSTKKLTRDVVSTDADYFDNLIDLLEYLKVHNTGRDEDIAKIRHFEIFNLNNNSVQIELLRNIICKNLQLGIDVLSINKVIPNLIPTFNVQLANKYFDKPEFVEGKHFALTTKIDGGRIIAIKQNGVVELYTRAGQRYEGLVDLEKELMELDIDNICFDGEITLLNKGTLTSKEQYKETMKITRKDGEKHGVKMLVFDVMTADQFKRQKCENTYYERRAYLNQIFCEHDMIYFECLPVLYEGYDTAEITKWLNYNIEHGEEGVMINLVDAPYEFKRSNNLLKVKKMQDIDLPIIDFEEGTNQYTGSLGALITEYKGFKLKVGSGISKELRQTIWDHKEDYRGLTMSVQYFEETTNQNGGISLRFPILLDIRRDK